MFERKQHDNETDIPYNRLVSDRDLELGHVEDEKKESPIIKFLPASKALLAEHNDLKFALSIIEQLLDAKKAKNELFKNGIMLSSLLTAVMTGAATLFVQNQFQDRQNRYNLAFNQFNQGIVLWPNANFTALQNTPCTDLATYFSWESRSDCLQDAMRTQTIGQDSINSTYPDVRTMGASLITCANFLTELCNTINPSSAPLDSLIAVFSLALLLLFFEAMTHKISTLMGKVACLMKLNKKNVDALQKIAEEHDIPFKPNDLNWTKQRFEARLKEFAYRVEASNTLKALSDNATDIIFQYLDVGPTARANRRVIGVFNDALEARNNKTHMHRFFTRLTATRDPSGRPVHEKTMKKIFGYAGIG